MEIRKNINLQKIKNLFYEIDQLLEEKDIAFLQENFKINNLTEVFTLPQQEIEVILNSPKLMLFIDRYKKTTKKWIRLTKTVAENDIGEKSEFTTITIKHILKNNESGIQQMKETEIVVNSFEETNELLENLGFFYRSYQEKKRKKYVLNDHEIDIDTWPGLPTYFEIEGENKVDLETMLNLLGYSFEEAVSCTADELYQERGIDINNQKELKF